MRPKLIPTLSLFALLFFKFNNIYSQTDNSAEQKATINWLQKTAIPIKYVQAGNGFTDLQPLKKIFSEVRIVGLGESTHGTREFFQFKHRLFEFLVMELGFTVFTIESGYSGCQDINDYVLYGKGDLKISLASQGYTPWDTEEFTDMLKWMRAYNQSAPVNKKLKFVGVDVNFNGVGRRKVLTYFTKVAPELKNSTDSLFRLLEQEDENWPYQLNSKDSIYFKSIGKLQHLINYMQENKPRLVGLSSPELFEHNLHLIRVMKQGAESSSIGGDLRDQYMTENFEYVQRNLYPNEKFVYWAHNGHVTTDTSGGVSVGYFLKRDFGEKYYSVGFEFNEGGFKGKSWLANIGQAEIKEYIVPPSPNNSLGWWLKQTNMGTFFLNLRNAPKSPEINQWLNTVLIMHGLSWVPNAPGEDSSSGIDSVILQKSYDAIFFIEKTSGTHPTGTAVKMNRY
jgi:erythromycin esterase